VRAILFFLATTLAWGQAPAADAAGSAGVRNVYLMPMPNGLEQFIANQLTSRGLMTVVADPNLADALFTDTVGKAFEKRYLELYPPPAPPKEEDEEEEEKDRKKRSSSSSSMDVKDVKQERTGGFSRGKGTIFLVDRRTKTIGDRIEETVKKGGGLSR
jgi:hypothetical protein